MSLNRKRPRLDRFTVKSCQILKKQLISTFLKMLPKTEGKGTLTNSFCEGSITLIPKVDNYYKERKP